MKKRGLILSTIVMVVVLAVAITTATYAWFSSTAAVEVRGVEVQTVAAEGLQIAVKDGSNYYNGDITYATGAFGGSGSGFGSVVDFTAISGTGLGAWSNAVTKYDAAWDGIISDSTTSGFLVPADYDGNVNPTDMVAAVANTNYLYLPISVTPTVDMTAIVCTITVTPKVGTMGNPAMMPGMAAASFIEITSGGNNVETLEPFRAWERRSSGMFDTDNGNAPYTNQLYTYSFVVAYDAISAGEIYDLEFTIWIEGTDDECHNVTAGSGFGVDIAFNYDTTGSGITDFGAIGVEWDAIESQGFLTISTVKYNIIDLTIKQS